jgi:pimeloyl-ACP methyl ester carboxylesterase
MEGATAGGLRLGDRTLRWVEAGSDRPTVVLEAGYGDTSIAWESVLSAVAPFTHVVAYDRAGLGRRNSV